MICSIQDCEKSAVGRGWCSMHYARWSRHGNPNTVFTASKLRLPRTVICSIEGCDKPVAGRGWCSIHYSRWWSKGDPEASMQYHGRGRTLLQRVMDRSVETETGCWEWTGPPSSGGGYARVENKMIHRVTYEHHVGMIVSGNEIHHHCGNRLCCNPDHLESMTHAKHLALHNDRI